MIEINGGFLSHGDFISVTVGDNYLTGYYLGHFNDEIELKDSYNGHIERYCINDIRITRLATEKEHLENVSATRPIEMSDRFRYW